MQLPSRLYIILLLLCGFAWTSTAHRRRWHSSSSSTSTSSWSSWTSKPIVTSTSTSSWSSWTSKPIVTSTTSSWTSWTSKPIVTSTSTSSWTSWTSKPIVTSTTSSWTSWTSKPIVTSTTSTSSTSSWTSGSTPAGSSTTVTSTKVSGYSSHPETNPGDLTFIIDVSGSMRRNLNDFKRRMRHLMKNKVAVKNLEKTFDRFVLVAFSDPYIEVEVAKDVRSLYKLIRSLRTMSKATCAEPTYASIIEALNASQRNSVAILMTDSSPKTPELYTATMKLARKKRLTLISILFGKCGPKYKISQAQLVRLAYALGGRTYDVTKTVSKSFLTIERILETDPLLFFHMPSRSKIADIRVDLYKDVYITWINNKKIQHRILMIRKRRRRRKRRHWFHIRRHHKRIRRHRYHIHRRRRYSRRYIDGLYGYGAYVNRERVIIRNFHHFKGRRGDLVFVVDLNSSMKGMLKRLKRSLKRLHRHKRSATRHFEKLYKRFVLVTFNYRHAHISYFTHLYSFYKGVLKLRVNHRRHCKAPIYTSLLKTIRHVHKNSVVLLFTNSSPRRSYLHRIVRRRAVAKSIPITVVSFGACNRHAMWTKKFLSALAMETDGDFYEINEAKTPWVMNRIYYGFRTRPFDYYYVPDAYLYSTYDLYPRFMRRPCAYCDYDYGYYPYWW